MDYKSTLNMPKTDFEMRGNLAKKEPGILEAWEKKDHYHQILAHHKGEKAYVLHDGPPYANGNLHAGTAMNRCIKDFIIRSHAMSGYYTPFFPGWDTHGLPIENAIQKLGVDRKSMSPAEFRSKCEQYAHEQIKTQMATEKRLGQIADYEHPYITLTKEFEARQIRAFEKMALDGLIFQGLKPIYWSPFNETAIADSEIVYRDVTDATIYLAFQVADGKGDTDGGLSVVLKHGGRDDECTLVSVFRSGNRKPFFSRLGGGLKELCGARNFRSTCSHGKNGGFLYEISSVHKSRLLISGAKLQKSLEFGVKSYIFLQFSFVESLKRLTFAASYA